jgi:cytochrome c553
MRHAACIVVLATMHAVASATAASSAERPDWAFPVTDKVLPPSKDDGSPKTAPGSALSLTRAQIDDLFNAPDWFPDMHPPMPPVVAHGNKDAGVRACGSCHLPTGTGHDESAYVAGLPAAYTIRQMNDYKSGDRKGSATMVTMAKAITDQEIRAAADYFASLKPRPWIRVVEADTVPRTFIGKGNKRLAHPDGGSEPIGNRIIEIPEDEDIVLNRDPRAGFVAYVPKGSIAKGENLVVTGGAKTVACAICHGPDLRGLGEVPAIAGRHPNYIVRQLWGMQNGERSGSWTPLMQAVVARLDADDMLAIAAYVGSRAP